jgi:hypothetical protein
MNQKVIFSTGHFIGEVFVQPNLNPGGRAFSVQLRGFNSLDDGAVWRIEIFHPFQGGIPKIEAHPNRKLMLHSRVNKGLISMYGHHGRSFILGNGDAADCPNLGSWLW